MAIPLFSRRRGVTTAKQAITSLLENSGLATRDCDKPQDCCRLLWLDRFFIKRKKRSGHAKLGCQCSPRLPTCVPTLYRSLRSSNTKTVVMYMLYYTVTHALYRYFIYTGTPLYGDYSGKSKQVKNIRKVYREVLIIYLLRAEGGIFYKRYTRTSSASNFSSPSSSSPKNDHVLRSLKRC